MHAYVTSMRTCFQGAVPLRLFDARPASCRGLRDGPYAATAATGAHHRGARWRARVTAPSTRAPSSPTAEYLPQFYEDDEGFDVAIGSGRDLTVVLGIEYPGGMRRSSRTPRIVHIALQLSASLRNARLLRESLYRATTGQTLEHANAPILVIGRKREIRVVNRALVSLTGFRRDELIGRDFASLLDEEERSRLLPVLIAALRGQSATGVEVRVPSKHGTPVRLLMNTASVLSADGEVEGVIAIGGPHEIRSSSSARARREAGHGRQWSRAWCTSLNNPLTSISVYSDYLLKQRRGDGTKAGTSSSCAVSTSRPTASCVLARAVAYARPTRRSRAWCAFRR